MRWEQMMYYENKKDVKRQVYVDTLNSFDAIHLTGKYAFKISHQQEGKKSAIFLIFHSFIWMLSNLGLFWFWFTNEFSETTLLLFVFFFNETFNFSSEDWYMHQDMS